MILEVQKGAAAEQAGLKAAQKNMLGEVFYGDIIVSIDKKPVLNNEDLIEYLDSKKAKDKVNIRFLRSGKEYGTTVILQELRN